MEQERCTLRKFIDSLNRLGEEHMEEPIYFAALQRVEELSFGGIQGYTPRDIMRDVKEEIIEIHLYPYFGEIGIAFGFESDTYWKEPPPEEDEDDFLTEEDEEGFPTGDEEEAEEVGRPGNMTE